MQNNSNKFPMTDIILKLIETDRNGCIWLVLFVLEKSKTDYFKIPYIETDFDKHRHQFELNQLLLKKLTATEKEIVSYLFDNIPNNEIADLSHRSYYTIRTHIKNIYNKIEVEDRLELQKKLLS